MSNAVTRTLAALLPLTALSLAVQEAYAFPGDYHSTSSQTSNGWVSLHLPADLSATPSTPAITRTEEGEHTVYTFQGSLWGLKDVPPSSDAATAFVITDSTPTGSEVYRGSDLTLIYRESDGFRQAHTAAERGAVGGFLWSGGAERQVALGMTVDLAGLKSADFLRLDEGAVVTIERGLMLNGHEIDESRGVVVTGGSQLTLNGGMNYSSEGRESATGFTIEGSSVLAQSGVVLSTLVPENAPVVPSTFTGIALVGGAETTSYHSTDDTMLYVGGGENVGVLIEGRERAAEIHFQVENRLSVEAVPDVSSVDSMTLMALRERDGATLKLTRAQIGQVQGWYSSGEVSVNRFAGLVTERPVGTIGNARTVVDLSIGEWNTSLQTPNFRGVDLTGDDLQLEVAGFTSMEVRALDAVSGHHAQTAFRLLGTERATLSLGGVYLVGLPADPADYNGTGFLKGITVAAPQSTLTLRRGERINLFEYGLQVSGADPTLTVSNVEYGRVSGEGRALGVSFTKTLSQNSDREAALATQLSEATLADTTFVVKSQGDSQGMAGRVTAGPAAMQLTNTSWVVSGRRATGLDFTVEGGGSLTTSLETSTRLDVNHDQVDMATAGLADRAVGIRLAMRNTEATSALTLRSLDALQLSSAEVGLSLTADANARGTMTAQLTGDMYLSGTRVSARQQLIGVGIETLLLSEEAAANVAVTGPLEILAGRAITAVGKHASVVLGSSANDATIRPRQSVRGTVQAGNGAQVTMFLSGSSALYGVVDNTTHFSAPESATARTSLAERDPNHPWLVLAEAGGTALTAGTVDLTLRNGGLWETGDTEDSALNTLTLEGGIVDMRGSTYNGGTGRYTRSVSTRAYSSSTRMPGYTVAELVDLVGNEGTFRMDVNTGTSEHDQVRILNSSTGAHTIEPRNFAGDVANGVPLLVVESVGALERPLDYQATFTSRPIEVGPYQYILGRATAASFAGRVPIEGFAHNEARLLSDTNRNNWYYYMDAGTNGEEDVPPPSIVVPPTPPNPPAPDPEPEPEPEPPAPDPVTPPVTPPVVPPTPPVRPPLTTSAKAFLSTGELHYLVATRQEVLRQRLGALHQVLPVQEGTTPWAQANTRSWTGAADGGASLEAQMTGVRAGVDRRLTAGTLTGGFVALNHLSGDATAARDLSGQNFEVGLYATHRFENKTYIDLVGRWGRTETKFTTTDTLGKTVKARDLTGNYGSLSVELGRPWDVVPERFIIEPMVKLTGTTLGAISGQTDHGLRAKVEGMHSVTVRVGVTAEGTFGTQYPVRLSGRVAYERELTAKTDVVFNGANREHVDYRGGRVLYGVEMEGKLGKASTWLIDVERSTHGALNDAWQVRAGIRVGF